MSYDKIAKQLENPSIKLDTLARYAQGQNPAVPEFLALAEIKRRQSLVAHSPAPAQTTVQEDLTRSAMPQPMGLAGMQRPQGVAALQSGMGEQSFAGGGIVAFDGANGSLVEEDQDAGLSSFEKFRKYLNSLGGGVMPRGGAPVNALPGQVQAVRSGKGSGMPMTSEQVKAMMPADSIQGDESKLFEAEALAKKIAPKGEALPTVGEKGRMAPTTEETKPKEDMYAKYEEMLKGQAAESKAARDQDKYMRLLEAGLGIMGGTSQYALQNIGQGAMGAAKTFPKEVYEAALLTFRPQLQKLYADYFKTHNVDVILYPTTPIAASTIDPTFSGAASINGAAQPGGPNAQFGTFIRNTDPSSNAGIPGLSIPAGLNAAGFPVRIEINGP